MRFVKGHGTANDFVVVPDPDGELDLSPGLVAAICDRRRGVGGDGLLRVTLSAATPEAARWAADARWFMDYRNGDGSIAEMCGNGIRVFARYLVDAGYAAPGRFAVATRAGVREVDVPANPGGDVSVDMGPPEVADGPGVPVTVDGRSFEATAVSMGNPHAVCFADDLDDVELAAIDLSRAPSFPAATFPTGVNVEVVVPHGANALAMRVHERGVGETASCGTGACAAAVAFAVRLGTKPPTSIDVTVPGGRLSVVWESGTVVLRGPAVLVGEGVLRPDWLAGAIGVR